MSREELVRKMRGRVEQCRRLATYVTDEHTKRILDQMADEGEADLRRFLLEPTQQDNEAREA